MSNTFKNFAFVLIISLFLGLFVPSLAGCAKKEAPTEDQSDTVTIRSAEATKITLPQESVSNAALLDKQLIVAGKTGDEPQLAILDLEGKLLSEIAYQGEGDKSYIYGLTAEKDGFALLLGDKSKPKKTDNVAYTLVRYTAAGEVLETVKLQNVSNTIFHGIMASPKGEYICWNTDGVYIFDKSGNLRTESAAAGFELISLLGAGEKIFAAVYQNSSSGVCALDPDTGNLGEAYMGDGLDAQFTICSGADEKLYVNDLSSLYEFDIKKNAFTKLFNWETANLKGTDISRLVAVGDDEFICVSSGELYSVTLKQETTQREKIVVGFVDSSDNINENNTLNAFVDDFNKSNAKYYAEIKHYKNSEIPRLKTELVAGTAPDVLELSCVSMDMDLSSVYYTDLLPLIDSDPTLSRDDFVESVLNSIITDGRLTSIPASFYINTVAGRTKDVGSVPGWTMSDLKGAMAKKGDDCVAFPGWLTAKEMMGWVSTLSMGQFVDFSTMTCNFTHEDFIDLMNFCKERPEEFETNAYVSDYDDNILLTVKWLQNVEVLESVKRNYNGEDVTYIGFPNSSGNTGSYFTIAHSNLQFAIPEQTKNKDGAWAFVREMLSAEYQSTIGYDFPILESELMQILENQLNAPGTTLTQKDVDKFLELINNTEIFLYGDSSIQNIILEEAIAFFENAKTAEEVAELIQSRVSLYLAEKG